MSALFKRPHMGLLGPPPGFLGAEGRHKFPTSFSSFSSDGPLEAPQAQENHGKHQPPSQSPLSPVSPFSPLSYDYEPIEDAAPSEQVLIRLRLKIYQSFDHRQIRCHREFGRLATGCSYFFLQPFNASGFLFEGRPSGWLVTQAQKIIGDETFIRDGESLEQVVLLMSGGGAQRSRGGELLLPRVTTALFQETTMALSLYEMRMIQWLVDECTGAPRKHQR